MHTPTWCEGTLCHRQTGHRVLLSLVATTGITSTRSLTRSATCTPRLWWSTSRRPTGKRTWTRTKAAGYPVIVWIGPDTAIESLIYDGVGPLSAELSRHLAGAPTAVVFGELPSLPVVDETVLQLVDLADEVVVVGESRARLDETLRSLMYARPERAVTGLAVGGLRLRATDSWKPSSTPVGDLLVAAGCGRRVTLQSLDRLAVRRRRSGQDAMAGRTWRAAGRTEIRGGCVIGDAATVAPRDLERLPSMFDLDVVDLRQRGVEAVVVAVNSGDGFYDVTGPSNAPDGIRLATLTDAFDPDTPYVTAGEVHCASGRLVVDARNRAGHEAARVFAVSPGSDWLVELHDNDGWNGLRARRLRAHAEITQVRLRLSMCLGACPAFDLTLRADGAASWEGTAWVEPRAVHRGRLQPRRLLELPRRSQRRGSTTGPRHCGRGKSWMMRPMPCWR